MSLLRRRESNTAARRSDQFLIVACGVTNLAFPSGLVQAILKPEEMQEGERVTFLNVSYRVRPLSWRLGLSQPPTTRDPRIILCGGQDRHRGYVVDRVQGLMEAASQLVRPLPPHFVGEERKWFAGLFLFETSVALLMNPEWLLEPDTTVEVVSTAPRGPAQNIATASTPTVSATTAPKSLVEQVEHLELEEAADVEDVPWANT
ncbi:MAG: hypothetical protein E6K60_06915 [Nitrospirae bacterium]|nr:MAG: hypothetical protein E6K60_06915 [Nitrospirota bacterium]